MGAIPQHPFFLRVLDSLQLYDKDWGLPYITVMYSTGPLFLSVIWKEYMASGLNVGDSATGGRVRVLMQDEYNKKAWSFFTENKGSSWHGDDAKLIFWMGGHWMLLTAAGLLAAGVLGAGLWWIYGRIFLLGQRARQGPVKWRGGLKRHLERWWQRGSAQKYELVDRHEV